MALPPPEPEYQNETAQEGNGKFTGMTEILHENILTVSIKVIAEPVVVSPVINPPEVIRFPLKIDVPLPLPTPILPLSPPYFPPPLPPQFHHNL